MGILSWFRARRRRSKRRGKLAAKIFAGMTNGGGPAGWSEEDCAQIADLLAERTLRLRREKALERWSRRELRKVDHLLADSLARSRSLG